MLKRFEFLLSDGSTLAVYAYTQTEAARKAREMIYS